MAHDLNDQRKTASLLETARSLEAEAGELLVALTEHRNKSHAAKPQ